jgi:hypothetical protein
MAAFVSAEHAMIVAIRSVEAQRCNGSGVAMARVRASSVSAASCGSVAAFVSAEHTYSTPPSVVVIRGVEA